MECSVYTNKVNENRLSSNSKQGMKFELVGNIL